MTQSLFGLRQVPGIRLRTVGETSYFAEKDEGIRDQRLQDLARRRPEASVEPCVIWDGAGSMVTGLKAFDRQNDCIMTGNVWGTGQFSNHLRSTDERECNGRLFGERELFRHDLELLLRAKGGDVFNFLRKAYLPLQGPSFPGGWGYLFRYFDDDKRPVLVGAIVTDRHGKLLRRIDREDYGLRGSSKARIALDACELLVTDRREVH